MQKIVKYTIFKTRWGYFGLAGTTRLSSPKSEYGLLRTCLPLASPEKIKSLLLKSLLPVSRASRIEHQASRIEFDKTLFRTVQEQIIAYFEGAYVNFNRDIPIVLACPERTCPEQGRRSRGNGFSLFARQVYTACRNIRFGQTISYGQLARKIGRATAARAIGNALAKNPLPLIIPCHRVIHSDGKVGGFSAPGGASMKKRLLLHEKHALT